MPVIRKVILQNFKQFTRLDLEFDPRRNVLIGDNETGKSSVLLALDLALSASRTRIENLGFDTLFCKPVVEEFLDGPKGLDQLPELIVDVFLEEGRDQTLYGTGNLDGRETDGLRMVIEPVHDYGDAIQTVLAGPGRNFPFEYYTVRFQTFARNPYTSFNRPVRHLLLDSSRIDNEYAAREYTRSVYHFNATVETRYQLENAYRMGKQEFKNRELTALNQELAGFQFDVRSSVRSNLESDLVITEGGIALEHRGKGRQCFIKTQFALNSRRAQAGLDVMLLEEPENHLSHTWMKRLVDQLSQDQNTQLFVATHSSHICSRLDLRKALLLGTGQRSGMLKDLSEGTAEFFMKAPDNNVLEFALSSKVILVEGDAEFILLEAFYKKVSGGRRAHEDHIHVIAIGGTSFKRYLELASLLGTKVAAIRDNDGNYEGNCVENYTGLVNDHAMVFADQDNARRTFEIGLYEDNQAICDELFAPGRKSLTPLEYMLGNKAEAAFELLDKKEDELVVPGYIVEAIEWVRM
ncbi:AAA ATPase domain protein [compost metagenome]